MVNWYKIHDKRKRSVLDFVLLQLANIDNDINIMDFHVLFKDSIQMKAMKVMDFDLNPRCLYMKLLCQQLSCDKVFNAKICMDVSSFQLCAQFEKDDDLISVNAYYNVGKARVDHVLIVTISEDDEEYDRTDHDDLEDLSDKRTYELVEEILENYKSSYERIIKRLKEIDLSRKDLYIPRYDD